jgi:aspartate aminotransferase
MSAPRISDHFKNRHPSAIRLSQIEFDKRTDQVKDINTAIGNVSLPTHPAMQERMFDLKAAGSPFAGGVVKYTPTVGLRETREAFLNVIGSSGLQTDNLNVQITDGGSQAMELVVLGCCGPAGSDERPLLLIDPAYTNYLAMARRVGRQTVSVKRILGEDGRFSLPDLSEIEEVIQAARPGAMVVIPYDNPTGHFTDQQEMQQLARLCVKYDMWIISDEAYREIYYLDQPGTSIWRITDREVPGIGGRRIGIETTSKVWNCCGLRIGALVTDNREFHEKSVAENTANLCSNAIGQYIFGAMAHVSQGDLKDWYGKLRDYYRPMLASFSDEMQKRLPGVIVSSPRASIYSVVDVRRITPENFSALEFVLACARTGKVRIGDQDYTLLTAPMAGFYSVEGDEENPGRTQMRIAYVPPKEEMELVPRLFAALLRNFDYYRTA